MIFKDQKYNVSALVKLVHCSFHETLMYFGSPNENNSLTVVIGLGYVKKIEKGEDFDIVIMSFGRRTSRTIIVRSNQARRQIYTLKRGQYAWFFGTMKTYRIEGKNKPYFFATGFQGWYVPKNFDIKQLDKSELDRLSPENEKELDFIDKLLNGGND